MLSMAKLRLWSNTSRLGTIEITQGRLELPEWGPVTVRNTALEKDVAKNMLQTAECHEENTEQTCPLAVEISISLRNKK
jgi:hypothetical protein